MSAPELVRSQTASDGHRYWVVTGPAGAVTWGIRPTGAFGHIGLHADAPMWDDHQKDECEQRPDGCYLDMHFGDGQRIGQAWVSAGCDDDTIWSELEGWYNSRLRDIKFVPVDVSAAMGVHGPLHLRDEELRAVLAATIAGETIQDAIRTAYRSRRARFRNLASDKDYPEPLREEVWRELCEEYSEHDANPFDLLNALRAELENGDQEAAEVTLDALTGVPR